MSSDPSSNESAPESPRYSALCERAIAFVVQRGGAVPEDVLVGHVFGNAGSLDMWRPLLRNVLQADDRVTFRADGTWALRGSGAIDQLPGLLLDEFVAIDVETTGLKPRQQRVIEVALIRYKGGQEVERFESLLNPDREIPIYIANLTTITNAHVEDAPRFHEVADRVLEFIDTALLVGHNIGFDLSFVNAELERCDRVKLVNERIDTMGIARRFLPSLRKASLDSVARQVGLQPRKIHRAGGDAQLTAEVAIRLVGEAVRQGVTSVDQLKSASTLTERKPRDDIGRGRAVMDKTWLKEIPRKPGVYLMHDQFGNIIYVGKAKSLRERVSSYYHQPLGYTRKMDGLLESMVKIDTHVVGSEIEALLLEAQLIRRYQPRYNTAMRSFEHYPYIRVDTSNPWPRVSLSKQRKDDGATYFGPYRSSSSARRTVDVINGVLPLRTCTRSFKNARSYGHPCILLDMGKCLGPCTGKADRDEYLQVVHDVTQLLDGRDQALMERLWGELEHAAETLDFEKAAALRRDLRSVLGLVEHQQKLREAEVTHTMLLVLPSADPAFRDLSLIYGGRIWARFQLPRDRSRERSTEDAARDDVVLDIAPVRTRAASREDVLVHGGMPPLLDLARRIARADRRHTDAGDATLDHHMVDEHAILNRWLMRHHGNPALLPLPEHMDEGALLHLLAHAQRLSDDDLVFREPKPTEDDAEESTADAEEMAVDADPVVIEPAEAVSTEAHA
ncbi:MAG: exonuclease domain-containing protein [Thermomicrobiales bacterium]